ncbi:MAG: hypothetical protein AAB805_00900 [Patescibacteria group bacterium]
MLVLLSLFFPQIAHAFTMGELLVRFKAYIITPIISILFALSLAFFLWGIARFIWTSGADADREQGKNHMIWGLVGMVIVVSVYGIINVAISVLGIPPVR